MRPAATAPGGEAEHPPDLLSWLRDVYEEPSVPLLVSLLILLATGSWLTERFESMAIFELLLTLVMLGSIRQQSTRRRQAVVGVLLAVPTIICLWLRKLVPAYGLSEVGLSLLTLFLIYTASTILLHIFRTRSITRDTLSEALSVYLLMGITWACIYGLIYLQVPNAFHLPEAMPTRLATGITGQVPMDVLLYFSFVTLTTLGYGDVTPLASSARAMATLEVVLGQFYLAVLIARLIGLNIASAGKGA
jgi:ion channel